MSTFFDKISLQLARGTNVIVVILAGVMMLALILQVISRYVIGSTFVWTEELALFCFTWSVLLAATSVLRDGSHVSLDFLVNALPKPLGTLWRHIINLAILVFFIVFAVAGAAYLQKTAGQVSPALRLPLSYVNIAAPVCGILGGIHAICRLFAPRS